MEYPIHESCYKFKPDENAMYVELENTKGANYSLMIVSVIINIILFLLYVNDFLLKDKIIPLYIKAKI